MIRNASKVIANSTPTHNICLKKGIAQEKLTIVYPGVTYPSLPHNENLIQTIKSQHDLNNKKVLISVGRLTQRKGLNEFIDLSLPLIVDKYPETILAVIGDTPSQSLNKNLQSKELIIKTAQKHGILDNILFIGNISDDRVLSSWYYLADIHVFPVKHIPEDPEGFGMVAIEAAAHGIPTIAFATGGIIDAVENQNTGRLIPINDYHAFSNAVISLLKINDGKSKKNCQNFAEKFSWSNLKSNLIEILKI